MNQVNRTQRDQETAFIGKITAGISHELMNVLAIIRERSGLIEDFMALHKKADFPYRDKLAVTLTTIREQVTRGMEVGEKLNRFAHSMDESRVRLEVNDLLVQIEFLMQRFARLDKTQIKATPVEPPLTVDTDPFLVLLVLAACIEYCMDRMAGGGEIVLKCISMKNGTAIRCFCHRGANPVDGAETIQHLQDRLRDPIERLEAQLCLLSTDNQIGLELILP